MQTARAVRNTALMLVFALSLVACGGGTNVAPISPQPSPALPSFYTTTGTTAAVPFTSNAALAFLGGQPVLPLFVIPAQATNLGPVSVVFWGTKNAASGAIGQVTEAQVLGIAYGTPPGSVHAFLNAGGLPVLLVDDASGYGIALAYTSATTVTVTLCDSVLNPIAQSFAQTSPVASAAPAISGGSCTVAIPAASARRVEATATLPPGGIATDLAASSTALNELVAGGGTYAAAITQALTALLGVKVRAPMDNSATVPIGVPISLLFVGVLLLFLPAILATAGSTIPDTGAAQPPAGSARYTTPP